MADVLPQNFPYPTESAIASYPYQDIKEGTGTVQYMVCKFQTDSNSANDVYALITDSSLVSAEGVNGEFKVQLGANIELNFDVTFNTPKILNGFIYCNMSFEIQNSTVPKLRILKYDGATETELVAQITFQTIGAASGQYVLSTRIPISNKKISSGESLRIEFIATSGSGSYMLHDPTGSITGNASGGRTSFYVPFKLMD